MTLTFGAASDRGRVRSRNEDRFVADADLGIFAVVDGMGGHTGGEFASATISEALTTFIRASAEDSGVTWPEFDAHLSPLANRLQVAVRVANRTLGARARSRSNDSISGGGATVAAALFGDNRVAVSHVGDCRVYLLEDGHLCRITRDHSLVAEQVSQGLITEETAKIHPLRHVVTRAVNGQHGIAVDTIDLGIRPGSRLILCSDGIHGVLTDKEIASFASVAEWSLDEVCRRTVAEVNAKGGPDNATVVVIERTEQTAS